MKDKVSVGELLDLIHKWRAQANGHIRRGRGYKPSERHHALKALAQGGIYRLCASELESALGIPPAELKQLLNLWREDSNEQTP